MSGKKHRRGRPSKTLEDHKRDGTFRRDRHGHLLAGGGSGATSGAVAAFLAECQENRRPDETIEKTAWAALHFFGPADVSLHTAAALRELVAAFPDGLNSASWATKAIAMQEQGR